MDEMDRKLAVWCLIVNMIYFSCTFNMKLDDFLLSTYFRILFKSLKGKILLFQNLSKVFLFVNGLATGTESN